jgi:hypothetical protein
MGRGRAAASAARAAPPAVEPVKAAAAMAGWRTSCTPMSRPPPCTRPIRPAGSCWAASTRRTPSITRLDSSRWPLCALTTTGQPAARAEAVSPPSTEKAKGKLLAENMATGPRGCHQRCMAG